MMLINGWLHPLGEMEGDIAAVWHMQSKWLGAATGRLATDEKMKERRAAIVLSKLPGITRSHLAIASTDDEFYLVLLQQLVEIHVNDLTEVLGDTWLTD